MLFVIIPTPVCGPGDIFIFSLSGFRRIILRNFRGFRRAILGSPENLKHLLTLEGW